MRPFALQWIACPGAYTDSLMSACDNSSQPSRPHPLGPNLQSNRDERLRRPHPSEGDRWPQRREVAVLVPHGAGGALPPGACSRRSLGHLPPTLHWEPPRAISAPRGQPSFTSPQAGQPWSGPSLLLHFAAAPGTLGHRVLAAISARRVCGLHFTMLPLEFQLLGDRPHVSRWLV